MWPAQAVEVELNQLRVLQLRDVGPWKIDARFNRDDLTRRIRRIARFKSRITLSGLDAADYIRQRLPALDNAFAYLDPPYYIKGEGLYQHAYEAKDHQEIARLVEDLTPPWVVTYDAVLPIEELYKAHVMTRYDLHYNVQDRYRGKEIMVYSNQLTPPNATPPNVPWHVIDSARLGT